MFRVLQAQSVECAGGCLAARGDHLAEQLGDTPTEHRRDAAVDNAQELFEREPADQKRLETDRDLALQWPSEAQSAMQQISDPEAALKLEQGAARAVVADPSLGARGVENQICVAQQALDRSAGDRVLGMMVEDANERTGGSDATNFQRGPGMARSRRAIAR